MNLIYVEAVHINHFKSSKFDLESDEHAAIMDHLYVLPEGTIIMADLEKLKPHLDSNEVKLYRRGLSPMPSELKLETEDDFWHCLSYYISMKTYM